ncbi:putative root border cell-specific protein, partial [Trifolium medium]|nr:putative root border cell-specific protein [Trifolium medium]
EKAARLPAIEEIRTVLDRSLRGTLSTFSKVPVVLQALFPMSNNNYKQNSKIHAR